MKKYIIISCFVILVNMCNAQSVDHESWRLSKKTSFDDVKPTDLKDHPYHYLFYKQNEQFYKDKESGNIQKYVATHARVRINSKKGMEEMSSVRQDGSDELFQYRIIKADGEIIDKTKADKENVNLDRLLGNIDYSIISMYFANKIENLDTNCELEFIYVTRINGIRNSDLYGASIIQLDIPVYNYEYNHIAPDYLDFKFVGLNGCPEAAEDESDDKNYRTISIPYLKPFYKSPIAAISANKTGFLYKLYKNTNTSKTLELNQFSTTAKNVFENYMNTNDKDLKTLAKYLKSKPELESKIGLERIKALEYIIKDEFKTAYESKLLKDAISSKQATSKNMFEIFCGILNYWNEPYELVFATSRRYLVFDDTYDNFVYLDDLMIYLPKYGSYLVPIGKERFMDLIPSSLRENKGVFIKKIGVNDFSSGKNYIDTIPALDYKLNSFKQKVSIQIADNAEGEVSISSSIGGMEGLSYWTNLKDIAYEYEEDFFMGLSKLKYKDAMLKEATLEEIDKKKSVLDAPIKYNYSFSSKEIATKENNKLNIKIGGIINEAKSLQEKPKQVCAPDVFSGYISSKEISIAVPKGYTLANATALDVTKKFSSAGEKDAMVFEIKHKMEGDKLIITVTEILNRGKFNPEDMDNFLEVYNAGWNMKDLAVEFVKK